jgi:hypothetical protein
MSQYNKLMGGKLYDDDYGGFFVEQDQYDQIINAMNNPKGEGPPWWVVGLVSLVAIPVLVLPDPVPGSGLVAFGMLTATWWSKLASYGVEKGGV